MARVVEQNIRKPLAELILFGGLADGGVAVLSAEDGEELHIEVARDAVDE